MDKSSPYVNVKPVNSLYDDEAGSSSDFRARTTSIDLTPMKVLPRHEIKPVSRRDDSQITFEDSSDHVQNNTNSHRRDVSPQVRLYNEQPKWLQGLSAKNRHRIASFTRLPGVAFVLRWTRGPPSPQPYRIKPFLPKVQAFPTSLLSRYLPTSIGCSAAVVVICILWLIAFCSILTNSEKTTMRGSVDDRPIRLSCIARLWDDAPSCGVNGRACRPFTGSSFPFICPTNCGSVKVLNPVTVGNQSINYQNFVIGGPSSSNNSLSVYRGDSFICPAAVHAGIISNTYGGCAILDRQGANSAFPAVNRNGIQSIGFEPSFPLSISFRPLAGNCNDPQWYALIASVCATVLVAILAAPPSVFFFSVLIITFFQIALVSDAPYALDYADVISVAFGRFLPVSFIGAVLYRYCIHRTMTGLTAYWERAILWMGGCWVGALNAYTFDRLPLSRLTGRDLRSQPGAIVALTVIVIVILAAVVGQIWVFQREGRLLRYMGCYVVIGILIGCLVAVPKLDFRLHHYVLGLLLLPLTSTQTRPSLLYQGLLVGLFLNGIARWGFSSILQTPAVLNYGAQQGSDLPDFPTPTILNNTISFTLTQIAEGFDGISAVVNDVEQFQGTNVTLPFIFNWTRAVTDAPAFIRFAFTGTYTLGGVWYGDYTDPGTWFGNGTWSGVSVNGTGST